MDRQRVNVQFRKLSTIIDYLLQCISTHEASSSGSPIFKHCKSEVFYNYASGHVNTALRSFTNVHQMKTTFLPTWLDMCLHYFIRRVFKKFPHFFFNSIYQELQKEITSLFYTVTLLLCDAFFPASYQLFNAISKKCFWLSAQPLMHRCFHIIIT